MGIEGLVLTCSSGTEGLWGCFTGSMQPSPPFTQLAVPDAPSEPAQCWGAHTRADRWSQAGSGPEEPHCDLGGWWIWKLL